MDLLKVPFFCMQSLQSDLFFYGFPCWLLQDHCNRYIPCISSESQSTTAKCEICIQDSHWCGSLPQAGHKTSLWGFWGCVSFIGCCIAASYSERETANSKQCDFVVYFLQEGMPLHSRKNWTAEAPFPSARHLRTSCTSVSSKYLWKWRHQERYSAPTIWGNSQGLCRQWSWKIQVCLCRYSALFLNVMNSELLLKILKLTLSY